jgi:two-component system, cell cycle response regulator DivK
MAKILIVEDNEMNRDLITRRLAKRGYFVIEAVDGDQGLAMAAQESPDLIVADLGLPGMDGCELTRRLKAGSATKQIPVLALTAYARSEDRDRALAAGCDEFETKPIQMEALLKKIKTLLDRQQAESDPRDGKHGEGI